MLRIVRNRGEDKFYGDRAGGLEDPFGHIWYISTHKEDLSPEEIKKRAAPTMVVVVIVKNNNEVI